MSCTIGGLLLFGLGIFVGWIARVAGEMSHES